jgi:hypothetical protein
MSGTTEISFKEKLHYMEDILTLCSRNEDVLYLPNEQPMHVCMIKRLNIIEPGSRVKALALQATPLYPLGVLSMICFILIW